MIETKKKKKKKKNGTLKRSKESFEKQRKTQLERGLTYDMTKGMKWHNDGVRNMPVRYGEEPLASFKPGKLTFNVQITDGSCSKQICKNMPVPEGWYKGKTPKQTHNQETQHHEQSEERSAGSGCIEASG